MQKYAEDMPNYTAEEIESYIDEISRLTEELHMYVYGMWAYKGHFDGEEGESAEADLRSLVYDINLALDLPAPDNYEQRQAA